MRAQPEMTSVMSDVNTGSESADVDSDDDEAIEAPPPRGASTEAHSPRFEEEASVGYRLMGIEIFPPPYQLQPHMNETRRRLSARMPWRLTFALNSSFVRYELGALLAAPGGPTRTADVDTAAAASDFATEEVDATATATPQRQNRGELRVWCKVGGQRVQRPASCAEAATGAAPPITPTNAPSRRVHVRINGARCSFQPLVATFSVQSSPPTAAVAAPATRPRQSQVAQHQPTSPPPPFPESLGGAFGGFFTARRLPGNEDEDEEVL